MAYPSGITLKIKARGGAKICYLTGSNKTQLICSCFLSVVDVRLGKF